MDKNKAGRPQEAAPAAGAAPVPGRHFLLAIAIDAYEHCPRLFNCQKDAEDLIGVLTTRYQFEETHITRLYTQDATRAGIYDALRDLARRVTPDDNLLIYFSGHGELDEIFDEGYWIPYEAHRNKHDQYIANSWILKALRAVKSRHTFLVVDSCFSGSLFLSKGVEKNIAYRSETDPSRWGLTAGRKEVVSDGKPGDNSPFAEALIYRLRQNDKPLGIQELCAYVVEQVKAATRGSQEPIGEPLQIEGHKSGQFYFHPRVDEEAAWQAVLLQNTFVAFSQYRRQYSKGRYRREALQHMERLEEEENKAWAETVAKNTVIGFERYLDNYAAGPHVEEAKTRIDALLNKTPVVTQPVISSPLKPPPKQDDGMVFIQGGTFDMGDVMGDEECGDEKVHKVILSDFYLASYELTFIEYDRFSDATGKNKANDNGWGRGKRPVINVSWYDAVAYCNWLSEQHGYTPIYTITENNVTADWNIDWLSSRIKSKIETEYYITANWKADGYRLPTEAEWEYAARQGGQKVRFGNGKDIADPREINFNGSEEYQKSYSKTGEYRARTIPVGSFDPNGLGLYDMSGNVWEWCWDYWFGHYTNSLETNPRGPDPGSRRRVLRGGSYRDGPSGMRCAIRNRRTPDTRNYYLGFRIARSAS